MRVLFSDGLHLNNKNFSSLLEYLNQVDAVITRPDFNNDSICRFGDYSQWPSIVRFAEELVTLSADELISINSNGINLFDTCLAELMSKCATKDHWINALDYKKSKKELFDALFLSDKDDLLLNMASAKYWVQYWFNLLSSKTFDFVFVFSGSLTYSASLIEVMKGFQGRVFLFESFFTGRHYYCEEKYSHLPNNSDSRFKTQLTSRTAPGAVIDQMRLERGIKEALNAKNKNVSQPTPQQKSIFNNGKKTVLIGGQVLNDFSLLKTNETGIHSISVYKSIIEKILSETELNVIFKAHPWENRKNNLLEPKTKNIICEYFHASSRFAVVENYALSDLFSEVDYVFVINSQLGIEAALQGFKPIQVGNAFYGGYGFTYDINNLDAVVELINSDANGLLSIDEYTLLREYLMHMLIDYLVPEDCVTGIPKLKQIFNISPAKKLTQQTKAINKDASIKNIEKPALHINSKKLVANKKLAKLKRNPKKFLLDSRFFLLRYLGKAI